MEQTQEPLSTTDPSSPPPIEELIRPLDGRVIAGVARGLSNRFGLEAWLWRVLFIFTAFAGGAGVVIYAAGWALLRSEDESETPAERFFGNARSTSSWIGIALIAVAGLVLLGSFGVFSGQVLLAIALLGFGILLYTGHIPGPNVGQTGDTPGVGDKEGVQQMTPTKTLVPETPDAPAGASPAGGLTPPPPRPTPTPTPPDLPPTPPRERSILGRLTIGVMIIAMGVLALLDNIDGVPIDADPRHYLALAVTVLGVGLLAGTLIGRARWLIIVAAVLVPTLLFSPVFEYDWSGDTFDSYIAPTSFEQVQSNYDLDVGSMVIDLTGLPWNGEEVPIDARVDLGNLEVRIPEGVAVSGVGTVDIGRVAGPGGESFGMGDPTVAFASGSGRRGVVILDLDVNIGNIEVSYR